MNGLRALGEFIALDFETTGVSSENDKIIDIGAIRYRDGVEIERFSTLVNPERLLSDEISQLTGISNADLANAPVWKEVRDEFRAFLGKSVPIMAHNARFELSFLQQVFGLAFSPPMLDSYHVIALMYPLEPSHSLEHFIRKFNIRSFEHHRGLQDALDMVEVILHADKELENPRYASLCAIVDYWLSGIIENPILPDDEPKQSDLFAPEKLSKPKPKARNLWGWYPFFSGRHKHETTARRNFRKEFDELKREELPERLGGAPEMLKKREFFSTAFERYQLRKEQQEMAANSADILCDEGFYVVEAGTGTGKTLAYTTAALSALAVDSSSPVIISTHTKALQSQFLSHEFPRIKTLFNLPDLRTVVLKGMNNYVCLRKMEELAPHNELLFTPEVNELFSAAFVEYWSRESQEGEIDEIPRPLHEFEYPKNLLRGARADFRDCTKYECPLYEQCFYFKKEWESKSAHILAVNHSLLLTYPRSYPEFSRLIADEADELYLEAIEAFSRLFTHNAARDILLMYAGTHGSLERLLTAFLSNGEISAEKREKLPKKYEITDAVTRILESIARLDGLLRTIPREEMFTLQFSLVDEVVRLSAEKRDAIRSEAGNISVVLVELQKIGERIAKVGEGQKISEHFAKEIRELQYRISDVEKLHIALESFLEQDERKAANYLRIEKNDWAFISVPFNIGERFAKELLEELSSGVFTSATLSAQKDMRDFQHSLGLDLTEKPVKFDRFHSPFNYRENSRLLFLKGFPSNVAPHFPAKAADFIGQAAGMIGGRTLVLFTSKERLRRTHELLLPILRKWGIDLISHGITNLSVNKCVDQFKHSQKAVLMGTRGMWKGVDIPGKDLECLIIEKMPYAVPNPFTRGLQNNLKEFYRNQALVRGEEPDDQRLGQLAWNEVDKPMMFQAFRQMFGRLIRTDQDKGVMIVLDAQLQGGNLSNRHKELIELLPGTPAKLVYSDGALRELEFLLEEF